MDATTMHKNWESLSTQANQAQPPKSSHEKGLTLERLILLLTGQYPYAESSVSMRLSVLLCEVVSLFSTFSALEYPGNWYFYLIFLIVGHLYSYKYRNQGACLMKCLISFYMLFICGKFFVDLVASPYTISQSLVMLLTGLLVGHSFDLPRRKDLNYSILVSLLLLGFSATIFNTMTFAINLIAYLILFSQAARLYCFSQNSTTIFIAHSPNKLSADLQRKISQSKWNLLKTMLSSSLKTSLGWATFYLLAVLFTATVLFMLTPRFPGLANFRLQTSLNLNLNLHRESAHGELIDPSSSDLNNLLFGNQLNDGSIEFTSAQEDLGDNPTSASEEGQMIMQVRTNSQPPLYCRGLAYRHYDGRTWIIDEKFHPREVSSGSFLHPTPPMFSRSFYKRMFDQGWRPQRHKRQDMTTQIFYIEKNITNLIFAPYWTVFAEYPTETIFIDRDNGLRSPNIQEKGTVYTTNSLPSPLLVDTQQVDQQIYTQLTSSQKLDYEKKAWQEALNFDSLPPSLNGSNPLLKGDFNRREYQELVALPDNITNRTRFLTMRLTSRYSDPALKVLALAHFLRSNCDYINPAPQVPQGVELTDYFIFTTRKGNCRNFASSLAVMCRLIGIPSRYVSGYLAKTYNPFTGNYEVYDYNCHAWTEVFLNDPEAKWVTIDATSTNNVGGQKMEGVWFNSKPMFQYFSHKFKSAHLLNLQTNLHNPLFYVPIISLLLALFMIGWLLSNYQVARLIAMVINKDDWPLKQRFLIAGQLVALSAKLKIWQQTKFNSSIEQLYDFTKILLSALNIHQAPGQTVRQFCASIQNSEISSILQRIGKLYEEEVYAHPSPASSPSSQEAQPNLLSFFKHLSPQMQEELLHLLMIDPSNLHKSESGGGS